MNKQPIIAPLPEIASALAEMPASPAPDFSAAAKEKLYWAMAVMAGRCLERDLTQTAADILGFLLLQADVPAALKEETEELFTELEGRICPRVIFDAREFAADMDLLTMLEYLLDVVAGECFEAPLLSSQRPAN